MTPIIVEHLTNLICAFEKYFPNIHEISVQLDWVRNPFFLSKHGMKNFPVYHQEALLEVLSDRGLKLAFESSTLTGFWSCVKK